MVLLENHDWILAWTSVEFCREEIRFCKMADIFETIA
jgi:hypothetical protein